MVTTGGSVTGSPTRVPSAFDVTQKDATAEAAALPFGRYADPVHAPLSTVVVIATYRRPDYVEECLAHLERQTVAPARIVVVDASPDDLTRDVVARHPGVEYRRNPRGVGHTATSRAIGLDGAGEEIVAFIDDDAYAEPDWLERLLEPYADPDVAAVGGRARNGQPDEEHQGIGQIGLLLPDGRLTGYFAAAPDRVVEVDHMLGANMSVRSSVVRELGGIRDFYPGTCLREETDIALRMRRRACGSCTRRSPSSSTSAAVRTGPPVRLSVPLLRRQEPRRAARDDARLARPARADATAAPCSG